MLKQDNPIPLIGMQKQLLRIISNVIISGKGAKRAVLARELNLDEILNIKTCKC